MDYNEYQRETKASRYARAKSNTTWAALVALAIPVLAIAALLLAR